MQIVLLILLAFILRVVVINQSFWLDEAVSVLAANKFGYTGLINEFTKYDFHPPLFYVILKFWGSIFGYGEVALRLLPILFGIGTVWVVYKIARELKINATIAGLLMATSPLHVYYSQEVRMYPLVAFFVSLAFLLFFRILKKERLIYWIVFSFSLVVFMALDYV
ncbi:glycosyltransferase family 39 protein, partial [Candidatus Daviesbacteria bacterium]|nr:glycosyltransferase family 39 protein [Candidatus Daviesbacteria bacterium]